MLKYLQYKINGGGLKHGIRWSVIFTGSAAHISPLETVRCYQMDLESRTAAAKIRNNLRYPCNCIACCYWLYLKLRVFNRKAASIYASSMFPRPSCHPTT